LRPALPLILMIETNGEGQRIREKNFDSDRILWPVSNV
jgi:hypothetical protein